MPHNTTTTTTTTPHHTTPHHTTQHHHHHHHITPQRRAPTSWSPRGPAAAAAARSAESTSGTAVMSSSSWLTQLDSACSASRNTYLSVMPGAAPGTWSRRASTPARSISATSDAYARYPSRLRYRQLTVGGWERNITVCVGQCVLILVTRASGFRTAPAAAAAFEQSTIAGQIHWLLRS